MRKKYLSALLFGALLFASAGTFTSCKDYDDDINNLQSQIDKLATKEDMEAKLSQMETAINDAKATAEEALKAAQEAGSTEEIAKLEARIKALEDAALDVDALKKEIADSVEEQMADFREEMEKLLKEVEELTGYSLDMVTGISFVASDDNGNLGEPNLNVNYARVAKIQVPKDLLYKNNANFDEPTSYTFGEGMTGAFTIAKGDVNTVADYMVVNVDPVDAAVSAEMLSLVNGKGQNLNEYVDLTIKPYTENIIKTRAAESTGLRSIGVQLKNTVDFDAFDKLVLPGDAHHATSATDCKHDYIAYALAVTDADKSRTVTSPFDVTLHVTEEQPAKGIDEASTIYSTAASATDKGEIINWNDGGDNTTREDCYPVALDEAFTITVGSSNEGGRVMASYVVVDYDNESLSATDKAALKGLNFEGVNSVVKGESLKHAITIKGIAGIAVPLKLVTIDYTGKVQAFNIWVKAGAAVTVTASYTITPQAFVAQPTAFSIDNQDLLQAFTVPAGATQYSVELTAGETAHKGDEHIPTKYSTNSYLPLYDTNKKLNQTLTATKDDVEGKSVANFLKLYKSDKTNAPSKLNEVAYAEFVGTLNLQMMREDKSYEGTIRFYDETGTYLGANSIKVTKKLPTTVPADFSAKTNGINNGVMTVYPTEVNTKGEFMLYKTFNNWENHYGLTIDGVTTTNPKLGTYNAGTEYDPSKPANADFKGDDSDAKINSIDTGIIHNLKSYPATVTYNYGIIKFIPEGHGTIQNENAYAHIVTWGTNFDMQFNCWPVDCTYQWSQTPVVYYGESTTLKGKITTKEVNGQTTVTGFEHVIKALSPYNGAIDPFTDNADQWTNWAKVLNQSATIILITNNGGKDVENEYYKAEWDTDTQGQYTKATIKLSWVGAQSKPSADVETKVVLRLTDKFGHTHDIPALTFTMKINHE